MSETPLPELSYTSAVTGELFDLEADGFYFGSAPNLRGMRFQYTLAYRGVTGLLRTAREAQVSARVANAQQWDRFSRLIEQDALANKPGLLSSRTASGSVWTTRALILQSSPQDVHPFGESTVEFTLVLMDGIWRKGCIYHFYPKSMAADGDTTLDIPYDLPYDLASSTTAQLLESPSPTATAFEMTIFGLATNPDILIGNNHYKIENLTISEGGYLVINSIKKTLMMTDSQGNVTNQFSHGVRGEGTGSGSYIFEPLPAGTSTVAWDGSYGVDITLFEERSAPPWML